MKYFYFILALFITAQAWAVTIDAPIKSKIMGKMQGHGWDYTAPAAGGGGTPTAVWEDYDGTQDEFQNLVTAGDDYGSTMAALTDGTTALLAYRSSSSTTGGIVYAKVTRATASDTTLTQSTTTSSGYDDTDLPRACLGISATRALCAFNQETGTDSLVTQLIDLSGATPTVTDTDVNTDIVTRNGYISNIVEIGTNKYFFLNSAITTNDLYAYVVQVSGDTITVTTTDTTLNVGAQEMTITSYATDKVYGILSTSEQRIFTVSGTTVTAGDTETIANLDTASNLTPSNPFGVAYTGTADKILVTYRRRVATAGGRNIAAKIVSVASDTIDSSGTAYDVTPRIGGTVGQSTSSTVNIDNTYFYTALEEDSNNIEGVIMYYSSGDDSIRKVNNVPVQITSNNLDHLSVHRWDSNSVLVLGQNESSAPVKQTGVRVIFGNGSDGQNSWYPLASYTYTSNTFSIDPVTSVPEDFCIDDNYTRLFVNDSSEDVIKQFDIDSLNATTGVMTLTYQSANDYALTGGGSPAEGTSRGIACNADTSNLFIIGNGNDEAHRIELSVAGDLSTAGYTTNKTSFAADETNPRSIAFDSTYTRLFKTGYQGDDYNSYNLSVAEDLTTETNNQLAQAFPSTLTNPVKILVDDNGTSFMVSNGSFTRANRITVDEFDVSNWQQTDSVSTEWTASTGTIRGIWFSDDYGRMWIMNNLGVFYVFESTDDI